MARLRIAAEVPAPREEVYRFVTAWGPDGPEDEDAFVEKYGEILERTEGAIVTQETGDDDTLTWRCTFDYPARRVVEAVDSTWSDREDDFWEVSEGTRWVVTFVSKRGGLVGVMQWIFFRLMTRRNVRRVIVGPVLAHFREGGGEGA